MTFFFLNFEFLLPFKINGEVNIYFIYNMSPWALLLQILQIHFSYSCVFSPKHVSNVFCIYGLFAAAGERQGSDTLEAVKSCFYLQIKSVFFSFSHFSAVPCVATRGRNTTETGVKKI